MSNTMREILFRGKRVDNGEWVSGSILSFDDGGKVILSSTAKVFKEHGTTTICCNECYDVYPETVGRYTGLTDKNGVKIFEGDIVREKYFNDFYIGKVVFNKKTAGFEVWHDIVVGAYGEKATRKENFATCGRLEVIDNIHDTPELLEKSNET